MNKIKESYDIVIIGSGLGGLICALILSREGYSVCVLEKNAQIGGTLQTFKFDRTTFDTGVHYVGSLEPGQSLYPYFKYLGLMDALELEKMDVDGFDLISFEGDDQVYPIAQGYDNFKAHLVEFFPHEEKGLDEYIKRIKDVCNSFSYYYIDSNTSKEEEIDHYYIGAKDVIEECVKDEKLRLILAANNLLYAGSGDKSPFYIHALIVNSYIESSYRIIGGGAQISKYLSKEIKALGGEIHRNQEVVALHKEGKKIESVKLKSGFEIKGNTLISNIHPTQTFKLIDTTGIRKSYINRVKNLENTISAFVLYISLKPESLKYEKSNRYRFHEEDVWNLTDYPPENWGKNIAIYYSRSHKNPEYADSLILITYMKMEEVIKWDKSFNTTTQLSERDSEYQDFKEEKAQLLLRELESIIPGIGEKINEYNTSTPLTLRDYIGADGSLYGVERNYKSPLKSYVNSKTKLSNLLLTGQNTVMHGVLGVTIGAMVTCSVLLGEKYLKDKIKEA
jgi:all-trans-retinol 13,14-reductase